MILVTKFCKDGSNNSQLQKLLSYSEKFPTHMYPFKVSFT